MNRFKHFVNSENVAISNKNEMLKIERNKHNNNILGKDNELKYNTMHVRAKFHASHVQSPYQYHDNKSVNKKCKHGINCQAELRCRYFHSYFERRYFHVVRNCMSTRKELNQNIQKK
eukprot:199053_1